jgi:hypothetical protein
MFQVGDSPQIHGYVLTDPACSCKQDIVGALFRCVDCTTIDINICSNCETAGLPGNLDASDGGHNSNSHIMLKVRGFFEVVPARTC